jgi:hypothetical protein
VAPWGLFLCMTLPMKNPLTVCKTGEYQAGLIRKKFNCSCPQEIFPAVTYKPILVKLLRKGINIVS